MDAGAQAASTRARDDATASPDARATAGGSDSAPVLQRYCHVYRKGDLERLVAQVPTLRLREAYFDCSNWAVVAERLPDVSSNMIS